LEEQSSRLRHGDGASGASGEYSDAPLYAYPRTSAVRKPGSRTDIAYSVNGGSFFVLTIGTTISEISAGNTVFVTVGDTPFTPDGARRFMRVQVTAP
jgi:hypothetical protein